MRRNSVSHAHRTCGRFAYLPLMLFAGKYNVKANETSVSGISSGGFMAVQFHVAFSRTIIGAGITAGGILTLPGCGHCILITTSSL